MTTKMFVLEPANSEAKSVAHTKKGDVLKAGVALRKSGRASTAKQVEFPKMPKADLLAAIFNHDFSTATVTELRKFDGVKRPAKEPV